MDRLEKRYQEVAADAGMTLEIFNASPANFAVKLKKADAVVIFTNKVSHQARNEAVQVAKSPEWQSSRPSFGFISSAEYARFTGAEQPVAT